MKVCCIPFIDGGKAVYLCAVLALAMVYGGGGCVSVFKNKQTDFSCSYPILIKQHFFHSFSQHCCTCDSHSRFDFSLTIAPRQMTQTSRAVVKTQNEHNVFVL